MGTAPRIADPETERLSAAFDRFLGALRRARGRAATRTEARLTLAQLHLAGALDERPHRTVRELARATGVTQPTVTRALDALQRHGLVRRVVSPKDRRCVLVDLTDEGRAVLRAERDRIEERRRELLGQLSEEERRQAGPLLERLADLVDRI